MGVPIAFGVCMACAEPALENRHGTKQARLYPLSHGFKIEPVPSNLELLDRSLPEVRTARAAWKVECLHTSHYVCESYVADFPVPVHPLLLAVEPQGRSLHVLVCERRVHLFGFPFRIGLGLGFGLCANGFDQGRVGVRS